MNVYTSVFADLDRELAAKMVRLVPRGGRPAAGRWSRGRHRAAGLSTFGARPVSPGLLDGPGGPEWLAGSLTRSGGVGRLGLEPRTHGLKVRCSTIELTPRGARRANATAGSVPTPGSSPAFGAPRQGQSGTQVDSLAPGVCGRIGDRAAGV